MGISTVIHTNRYSIDRVLNAGLPVLLIFWDSENRTTADVDAILEAAASRAAGKLLIALAPKPSSVAESSSVKP